MSGISPKRLAAAIKQAWEDDYPPELAPANIKGRKMWRKKHLVELILGALPPSRPAQITEFVKGCGKTE